MTQKELLYIEDAVGHEESIIAIINNAIDSLCDESLISFMKKELKDHKNTKKKLISMLEAKANE